MIIIDHYLSLIFFIIASVMYCTYVCFYTSSMLPYMHSLNHQDYLPHFCNLCFWFLEGSGLEALLRCCISFTLLTFGLKISETKCNIFVLQNPKQALSVTLEWPN